MRGEEHGREDGLRVRRAERMGGAGIDDSGSGGYDGDEWRLITYGSRSTSATASSRAQAIVGSYRRRSRSS